MTTVQTPDLGPVELTVADSGTGRPVLLLHGGAGPQSVTGFADRLAAERGVPRAQVALAWVSRKPEVTAPIVGVSKLGQLDDAVASLELTLTDDEVARLEAPYVPQAVTGFA